MNERFEILFQFGVESFFQCPLCYDSWLMFRVITSFQNKADGERVISFRKAGREEREVYHEWLENEFEISGIAYLPSNHLPGWLEKDFKFEYSNRKIRFLPQPPFRPRKGILYGTVKTKTTAL